MTSSSGWRVVVVSVAALAVLTATGSGRAAAETAPCPADHQIADRLAGSAPVLCIVADHAHREGVFLIVDALVKNISGRPVTGAEVSVELYTYSGDLLGAESTILRPAGLGPGQEGTVLVTTPWQEGVEKLRYLITWRQAGRQHQGAAEHDVSLG
ncbi:MAG TPA: hypothetical protein VJX92_14500 [Methylomirabilota bacterium]|nr:hypothetical protein [Methylomirabilota bacterium]